MSNFQYEMEIRHLSRHFDTTVSRIYLNLLHNVLAPEDKYLFSSDILYWNYIRYGINDFNIYVLGKIPSENIYFLITYIQYTYLNIEPGQSAEYTNWSVNIEDGDLEKLWNKIPEEVKVNRGV